MSKYLKGMLYIRRMKATDKAGCFMTAVQMAAKSMLCKHNGKLPPFVMVRHGMRGMDIMHVADTRSDLESCIHSGGLTFKQISRAWRIKEEDSASN